MVKLLNMVLMISLILISLYIYADERILPGIIKKSFLSEKMIKSNNISSLLTLGEMYQKGLGVEKDLSKAQEYYRVAMNYVKSSEDIGFLHNTNDLSDYEESEVSETHDESSFDSTSENTNFIEKSEPEKDTDNINDLIFEQKRISVLKEGQIEFENNLEIYKNNLLKEDDTIISLAMNDGIYNDNLEPDIDIKYNIKIADDEIKIDNEEDIIKSNLDNNISTENINQEIVIEYYNNDDVVNLVEDIAMLENTSVIARSKNINQQETSNNTFTTNPCATESARYIAKCRRINRKK